MPLEIDEVVIRTAARNAQLHFGKYRGTVLDNADPEQRARLMVQVPAVMGEAEVGWALPALPFAGDGHGLVMLPEIGSGVWVEFEAGDVDHPIWTGCFLFENQSRPAPTGTGARVIASVQGHKLLLDDDGGTVVLEHSGGAKLEMTQSEVTVSIGASKMVMSLTAISFNDGIVKIGPAGVSLASGAMTLGVPPV